MTVGELIENLQALEPSLEILVPVYAGSGYSALKEIEVKATAMPITGEMNKVPSVWLTGSFD